MTSQYSSAISFMRFIALLCIVLHHCFCVYSGWPPGLSVETYMPDSYHVVSMACKGLGLVAFCFLSGLLVPYSFRKYLANSNKTQSWTLFITSKFKRLIIPAVIWGVVYYVFFNDYLLPQHYPSFINGTHLWFLPMLFLLMLAFSAMIFSKYLLILPATLFIVFLLYSTNRTTDEFIRYFPAFISGYMVSYIALNAEAISKSKLRWLQFLAITVGISFYLFLSRYDEANMTYAICLATAFSVITVFSLDFNKLSLEITKIVPIKFITDNSFTIYIVHQFVIILIALLDLSFLYNATPLSVALYFFATLVCSTSVAYLATYLKRYYRLPKYVI